MKIRPGFLRYKGRLIQRVEQNCASDNFILARFMNMRKGNAAKLKKKEAERKRALYEETRNRDMGEDQQWLIDWTIWWLGCCDWCDGERKLLYIYKYNVVDNINFKLFNKLSCSLLLFCNENTFNLRVLAFFSLCPLYCLKLESWLSWGSSWPKDIVS